MDDFMTDSGIMECVGRDGIVEGVWDMFFDDRFDVLEKMEGDWILCPTSIMIDDCNVDVFDNGIIVNDIDEILK